MSKNRMFSLGLRLALFVAVVVAMLAAVNVLTRDTIAERIFNSQPPAAFFGAPGGQHPPDKPVMTLISVRFRPPVQE